MCELPFWCFILTRRVAFFLLPDVLPLVSSVLVFAFLFPFLFLHDSVSVTLAVLQ